MATVYEVLRLLAAYGWTARVHIGEVRFLENRRFPGVYLTVRGKLSDQLRPKDLDAILEQAGLGGGGQ